MKSAGKPNILRSSMPASPAEPRASASMVAGDGFGSFIATLGKLSEAELTRRPAAMSIHCDRRRTRAPSVHVEWGIFAEHVRGRNEDVLRHRARRQRLAAKQSQGERQHVVALTVHVIGDRSEEHMSELQSHSFISYAVFC